MKAIVFEQKDIFALREVSEPVIRDDEVLVRVAACGLCGTDLHILKGEYASTFPLIPGHELAGTVVKVGGAVRDVQVNARVCVDPNIYCGQCEFCREGKPHLCEKLFPIGVKRDGGLAEYCAVPAGQIYRIPDHVDFSEAAMIEPLSCALHGIDLAEIKPGQSVLILGGGAIGGLLLQLARIAGAARVVVSEPLVRRRQMLLEHGADEVVDPGAGDLGESLKKIDPRGPDVIFEAAGLAVTVRQALGIAKKGAMIIFFGVVAPHERIEISPYEVFANEWTIRGSFINPFTVRRAVDLLTTGRVNVKPFVSHRLALEDFNRALQLFGQPDSYKIQIIPSH